MRLKSLERCSCSSKACRTKQAGSRQQAAAVLSHCSLLPAGWQWLYPLQLSLEHQQKHQHLGDSLPACSLSLRKRWSVLIAARLHSLHPLVVGIICLHPPPTVATTNPVPVIAAAVQVADSSTCEPYCLFLCCCWLFHSHISVPRPLHQQQVIHRSLTHSSTLCMTMPTATCFQAPPAIRPWPRRAQSFTRPLLCCVVCRQSLCFLSVSVLFIGCMLR